MQSPSAGGAPGLEPAFGPAVDVYGLSPYIPDERSIIPTAGKAGRERKTERLELRVAPSVRKTIERAIAVSGLAAGDLAYEGARRVLEDHERMVLRGKDREAFLKAVANPPPPATRLVAALRRHRRLNG